MKKPILKRLAGRTRSWALSAQLLFAYAIGKFINGFIAKLLQHQTFMATGLIVSAAANTC